MQVLWSLHLARRDSPALQPLQPLEHRTREPLAWRHAVEGIVYLLPQHGIISLAAEVAIAKHLVGKVRELDIEAQASPQDKRHLVEQKAEYLLRVHPRRVFPLAISMGMGIEIGRNPCPPAPCHHQQLAYHTPSPIGSYRHIGRIAWAALHQAEELRAMEEIAFRQRGQFLATGNDGDGIIIHSGKNNK